MTPGRFAALPTTGVQRGISFDGYNGQDVLVFEEFNSQVPIEDMLNYLDIYPLHLPARYNDRVACYTKVYLTSNLPLEKQYRAEQWDRPETWRAFLRRIHNVIEYLPDGSTVQRKKGAFPMTQNEKYQLKRRMVWRNLWQRLGWSPVCPSSWLFAALYLAGAVWAWSKQEAISAFAEGVEMISPIMLAAMTHAVPAYLLMGGVALVLPCCWSIHLADRRQKTSCKASAFPIMPGWLQTYSIKSGTTTIQV